MLDIPMDLRSLEAQIIAYEAQPIEKGKILFYGHSLFTRWSEKYGCHNMAQDLLADDGSVAVVNHGFGTSTTEELLYFYDRMVRPWEPRALVLASYSNDRMYGYGPERAMDVLVRLMHWARTDFPGIRIYLVEDHPCPKLNENTMPDKWNEALHRRKRYHQLLQQYAQLHEDTKVIQLWNCPELFETPEDVGNFRKVRGDLFVEDRVHPNQAGYDILKKVFREALRDLL